MCLHILYYVYLKIKKIIWLFLLFFHPCFGRSFPQPTPPRAPLYTLYCRLVLVAVLAYVLVVITCCTTPHFPLRYAPVHLFLVVGDCRASENLTNFWKNVIKWNGFHLLTHSNYNSVPPQKNYFNFSHFSPHIQQSPETDHNSPILSSTPYNNYFTRGEPLLFYHHHQIKTEHIFLCYSLNKKTEHNFPL